MGGRLGTFPGRYVNNAGRLYVFAYRPPLIVRNGPSVAGTRSNHLPTSRAANTRGDEFTNQLCSPRLHRTTDYDRALRQMVVYCRSRAAGSFSFKIGYRARVSPGGGDDRSYWLRLITR